MKLFTKLLLVIFSFIFLLSCSKDNTTNPQDTGTMADYMPLTIGSWWKYAVFSFDNAGNNNIRPTLHLLLTTKPE